MRFEGLNVAEFFSNIKDKLSKVTNAIGGNSDRELPHAANGTGLTSPESDAQLSTQTATESSEYVVEDSQPLKESKLDSSNNEYPIVRRDWQGLRRLIAWLEIEAQVTNLQTKGKQFFQPQLRRWEAKLPKKTGG